MEQIVQPVVDAVLGMDPTAAYVLIALLAFGEAAAFIGLFLPGETVVVLGGVLAAQGRVSLPLLLVIIIIAAITGDAAGYEIGRRWGPRLLATRIMRRRSETVARAAAGMTRWGGPIVFLGRWTGALRACVPALAGMTRMPYRTFTIFNVLGGVSWAVAFTLLGYAASASYERVEAASGTASTVLLGAGAAVIAAAWLRGRLVARR